ncbi:peptidase [Streptomyces sp. NPDC002788]
MGTALAPQAYAKGGHQATTSNAALVAQAKALAPLRAIANAVGEQGRGAYTDTYSNIFLDQKHHQVDVYATDSARGQKMIAAAKRAHHDIDLSKVKFMRAKYTKKQLDAAVAQIMASSKVSKASQLTVYSAAVTPDGSSVQVTAKPSAVAEVKAIVSHVHATADGLAGGPSIPVTVTAGSPIKAATWRWNDTYPLIGGDVLLGQGVKSGYVDQCTSGIAAENASTGEDYLITADHCYPLGADVFGEATPVGAWGTNYGNYLGEVTSGDDYWDAQIIDTGHKSGAGSNSDEADQPQGTWYPVQSDFYSYNGDSVCQDGARSYYDGHGVPCGINVVNQDITYNATWDDGSVHAIRGVEGQKSGWAVEQGDSGGLVFSVASSCCRQARGEVSAMDGNDTMFWTEAPDILGHFGLKLNPHT